MKQINVGLGTQKVKLRLLSNARALKTVSVAVTAVFEALRVFYTRL